MNTHRHSPFWGPFLVSRPPTQRLSLLTRLCLALAVLCLAGCEDAQPPVVPPDPIPAGVVLPAGMPNDKWFYENVVQNKVPVLVDFTATWCGPCKAMKPAIHEIETAYGARIQVVEVDIDDRPYLASHFQIRGVPRLMVIKDGQIQADEVGLKSYYEIISLLKSSAGSP